MYAVQPPRWCLENSVSVDVVVGPAAPVNRHPGGVSLGVEGSGGGVGLIRVDGDGRVALGLEVGTPWLVSLVPVAAHLGVIPAWQKIIQNLVIALCTVQHDQNGLFDTRPRDREQEAGRQTHS